MKKKKNAAVLWLNGIILIFLGAFFIKNINLAKQPVMNLVKKQSTFAEFTTEIKEVYTSDGFSMKNMFININGLFARITGQRVCNEVVRMENGMLTTTEVKKDMQKQAKAIQELDTYLAQENIPFLYVQAPYKEDPESKLLPKGVVSYAQTNANELLDYMEEMQINTLDLVPYLSAAEELIEKYYYKTDHHWNYTGAFVAFQQICQRISAMFPEESIDLSYTDFSKWNSDTLEKWFLGSRGKRVGTWFAGTDDFTWYTPKFETKMSCAIPKNRQLYFGNFAEANMRQHYLEEKDYFGDSTYVMYVGGDYPIVQHRNHKPVSRLKVLIIKDSYATPVQVYMSTVFKEVDVIDPRHLQECTVAEYVARTEPDLVMLLINPSSIGTRHYLDFGVEEVMVQGVCSENALWEKDILVEASDTNNYHYEAVPVEYGKTYTVSFEDVSFIQGEAAGVVTALYNRTAKTIEAVGVYDLEFSRQKQEFCWSFSTPASGKDEMVLVFYAGMPGATKQKSVQYQNVTLYEWESRAR